MVGIGITMEAIEQNYVVYEAVLENKWLDGKVNNISKWVEDYSSRRYGDNNIHQVKLAWEILKENVYFSHCNHPEADSRRRRRDRNVRIKMLSLPRRMREWCCPNFSPLYSGGNVWKTTELLLQIFN